MDKGKTNSTSDTEDEAGADADHILWQGMQVAKFTTWNVNNIESNNSNNNSNSNSYSNTQNDENLRNLEELFTWSNFKYNKKLIEYLNLENQNILEVKQRKQSNPCTFDKNLKKHAQIEDKLLVMVKRKYDNNHHIKLDFDTLFKK